MPTTVQCPQCSASLKVPEQFRGKAARCPRCKGTVPVPVAVEDTVRIKEPDTVRLPPPPLPPRPPRPGREEDERPRVRPAWDEGEDDLPPEEEERPRKKKKRKKGKKKGESWSPEAVRRVVGGVLGTIAVIAVVWFFSKVFRTPAPPTIPPGEWQAVEVPRQIKALLPGPPRREAMVQAGIQMVTYTTSTSKDAVYAVGYMEGKLPPHRAALAPEQLLNDSCDGAIANMKNMDPDTRELSRDSIRLGEFPGKELVVEVPRGNGQFVMRNFLAHGRLYIAMAGGRGFRRGQENVNRLFESIQILDTGEPDPPPAPPVHVPPPEPKAPEPAQPPAEEKVKAAPLGEVTLPEHAGPVLAVAFSRDGKTLVAGTRFGGAFWYDADSRKLLVSTPARKPPGVTELTGCAVAPAGDRVAFAQNGGRVSYVDRAAPDEEVVLDPGQPGGMITQGKPAFSPDGKQLCTVHGDRKARLWDLAGKSVIKELADFESSVGSAAFSPDGSLLACGDTYPHVWDTKTYQSPLRLGPSAPEVLAGLAFAPDGKSLAAVHSQSVFVWPHDPLRPGGLAHLAKTASQAERVHAAAFSPDGKLLVSASERGRLTLLDPATLSSRGEATALVTGGPLTLAFRPGTDQLAVGAGSRVQLLNVGTLGQK